MNALFQTQSSIFERNALQKYFEETYPECEVEVQFGGQPIYYYVISVE